jgi:hypothetical protein
MPSFVYKKNRIFILIVPFLSFSLSILPFSFSETVLVFFVKAFRHCVMQVNAKEREEEEKKGKAQRLR